MTARVPGITADVPGNGARDVRRRVRVPAWAERVLGIAADVPSKKMAMLKIQPSCVSFQSPGAESVIPRSFDIGKLNTLKAYACPMHRWMQRAAGGTNQRLNPGRATVWLLSRIEAVLI